MQDAQPSDGWDSFLQRAEHRGRAGTYMTNAEKEEDLKDRAPKEGEYLWEIGCKVCLFCLVHVISRLNSP